MIPRTLTIAALAAWAREARAEDSLGAPGPSLRGGALNQTFVAASSSLSSSGSLAAPFELFKRFDFSLSPDEEFDVEVHSDEFLTHSCSNYTNDGRTVKTENGKLHLRVDSLCEGGGCMNSGRVMSKQSFKYGLFTFSARVPKCNYVWPALWLLPQDVHGEGKYGRWPCSGEIDVLETVHDQNFGTFNVIGGYGSSGGCYPDAEMRCNMCQPEYCTSTTMDWRNDRDRYFVEETNCDAENPSWDEHLFVMNWEQDELTTWIDPTLSYDAAGHLVSVEPRARVPGTGLPSWRTYRRQNTPTWRAVENYMDECFPGEAGQDAPFDDGFKIVLNIAVGGYGGAPCTWGSSECSTTCGQAVGSELILSDISVWKKV